MYSSIDEAVAAENVSEDELRELGESLTQEQIQKLLTVAFASEEVEDCAFPHGVIADRGKHMKMNAADETGEDNWCWPRINLANAKVGDVLQEAAESYWRTHVNAFRQHKEPEVAHKHREEFTTGFKDAEISGEHQEVPIIHIGHEDIGDIKSKEAEKIEAKSKIQKLMDQGDLTREEVMEMLE